jgi:hypothetical protein
VLRLPRRRAAVSLRDQGVIDDEVLSRLERELDLEELRVAPDGDGRAKWRVTVARW